MKKKILIIYASYGSGHKTVANYLYDYFLSTNKYDIRIIDILDYENIIGKISKKIFEQNFKHKSSFIFTSIYNIFNFKSTTILYKEIAESIVNNKKLKQDIVNFNPDLVITSHFFGITNCTIYKKQKIINPKMISIITDYASHEFWEKDIDYIDSLIVANKIIKKNLIDKGIPKNKIYDYGIPISNKFNKVSNKEKIKKKYRINNNLKTIVFFAGGSIGTNFSYSYLKKLLEQNYECNVIFVCSHNNELRNKCTKLIIKNKYKNVRITGFINRVNDLLSISDIVITKPGGLSVTECLEMKKPMALIPGNGGPEIYNAKYVCFNGYGTYCKTPKMLSYKIGKILKNEKILKDYNKRLNKIVKNNSLNKIYKLSTKLISKGD